MKMKKTLTLLALMGGLDVSGLPAQDANQDTSLLVAGRLVRASVFDVPNYKFVGTFTALRPDTLWLQQKNQSTRIPIPLGSLTRLEVSRSQVPVVERSLKGFGIGFVLGTALGTVFANVFKKACDDEFFLNNEKPCQDKVEYRHVVLRIGVPVGVVGALFWTLKKTERWEKVPLERVRIK